MPGPGTAPRDTGRELSPDLCSRLRGGPVLPSRDWSRGICVRVEPSRPALAQLGACPGHCVLPRLPPLQRQLPLPWDQASAGRALDRDRTPCSLEEPHFLDWPCVRGSPEATEVGQVQEPREPGSHVAVLWARLPGGGAWESSPSIATDRGDGVGEGGWQGHSSPSKEDKGWPLTAACRPWTWPRTPSPRACP